MKADVSTILLVLARLASASPSAVATRASPLLDMRCAYVVNDHLLSVHEYFLAKEQEDNPLWNTSTSNQRHKFGRGERRISSRMSKSARTFESENVSPPEDTRTTVIPVVADNLGGNFEIVVPTYIHFITDLSADSMSFYLRNIQKIMDNLNAPFHPHGIHHSLRGMDKTHAPFWAAGMAPYEMIRWLRQGSQASLNFFVIDVWDMRSLEWDPSSSSTSSEILGATLSSALLDKPIDVDAVLIKTGAVEMSNVMAHEAGHWHGLLHTFEGGGCDPRFDHGDYVRDTPRQRGATNICPRGAGLVDTCPDRVEDGTGDVADPSESGPDAVDNVMDYTPERCRLKVRFTGGQVVRMLNFWKKYREPYL